MNLSYLVCGLAATLLLFPSSGFGVTIVNQPLDVSGYGYTSHEGQQQMFDHFELGTAAFLNEVSWYGQFSDGLMGKDQAAGSFNVFLFRSDPECETISPEGEVTKGIPGQAVLAFRAASAAGIGTGLADPLHGGNIRSWNLAIPTVFLDPGKYWISICAVSAEPGYYLWNHSSGIEDGVDFIGEVSDEDRARIWSASTVPERDSMAFSLGGTRVPDLESGLLLMAIAISALIGVKQVIRNRAARPYS